MIYQQYYKTKQQHVYLLLISYTVIYLICV